MNPRKDTLNQADQLINGDRNNQYGPPNQDFGRTANLWTIYLNGKTSLEAHDVAAMMILLKISRIRWSPEKQDHWIDVAGYGACGWDAYTTSDHPITDTNLDRWLDYQHTIETLEKQIKTLERKLRVFTGKPTIQTEKFLGGTLEG